MDIYFYQTYSPKDPKQNNTISLPAGQFVTASRDIIDPTTVEPNLFMKDISVYFGQTIDQLTTGTLLYTNSSLDFTYNKKGFSNAYKKNLLVKFIYQANDGKTYVLNDIPNNPASGTTYKNLLDANLISPLKVRWYVYNPGEGVNDFRAGPGWEEVTFLNGNPTIPSNVKGININGYGKYTYYISTSDSDAFNNVERTFYLKDGFASEKFKVGVIMDDVGEEASLEALELLNQKHIELVNAAIADLGHSPTDEEWNEIEKQINIVLETEFATIKAKAFGNETIYWSDELEFKNTDDSAIVAEDLQKALTLSFSDNGYNGNYLLYNAANGEQSKLINSSDAQTIRRVEGSYENWQTKERDLSEAVIRWYIPKKKTMITEPDWKNEAFTGYRWDSSGGGADADGNESEVTYSYQNTASTVKWVPLNGKVCTGIGSDGNLAFTNNINKTRPTNDIDASDVWENYYIFELTKKTAGSVEPTIQDDLVNGFIFIPYRIKEYLVPQFSNNTIKCRIIRKKRDYNKSVNLTFGNRGANGTGYTLKLGLGSEYRRTGDSTLGTLVAENVPAWTWKHKRTNCIELTAQLYNEKYEEVPDENVTYTWTIDKFEDNIHNIFAITTINNKPYLVRKNPEDSSATTINAIRKQKIINMRGAYLKCKATSLGKEYTQTMLVPMRQSKEYVDCTGTKVFVYTPSNTVSSTQNSKDIYTVLDNNYNVFAPKTNGERIFTVGAYDNQTAPTKNDEGKIYTDLAYLSNLKTSPGDPAYLVVPKVFYPEENYKMSVIFLYPSYNSSNPGSLIKWIQPVLLTRDLYTNTFLNEWDGSQVIDSKSNRIATAAIFSGVKNEDNTFTGVIVGELQGEPANAKEIGFGVYGRYHNLHTFGINVNGTAYLGDSTKGQLLIDASGGENSKPRCTIENADYLSGNGMRLDFYGDRSTKPYKASQASPSPYIDIVSSDTPNTSPTSRLLISSDPNAFLDIQYKKEKIMHVGLANPNDPTSGEAVIGGWHITSKGLFSNVAKSTGNARGVALYRHGANNDNIIFAAGGNLDLETLYYIQLPTKIVANVKLNFNYKNSRGITMSGTGNRSIVIELPERGFAFQHGDDEGESGKVFNSTTDLKKYIQSVYTYVPPVDEIDDNYVIGIISSDGETPQPGSITITSARRNPNPADSVLLISDTDWARVTSDVYATYITSNNNKPYNAGYVESYGPYPKGRTMSQKTMSVIGALDPLDNSSDKGCYIYESGLIKARRIDANKIYVDGNIYIPIEGKYEKLSLISRNIVSNVYISNNNNLRVERKRTHWLGIGTEETANTKPLNANYSEYNIILSNDKYLFKKISNSIN